jgi:hypothetical protein
MATFMVHIFSLLCALNISTSLRVRFNFLRGGTEKLNRVANFSVECRNIMKYPGVAFLLISAYLFIIFLLSECFAYYAHFQLKEGSAVTRIEAAAFYLLMCTCAEIY